MRIVDSFLMELEQEAATTKRVLERVPGDNLDWRPHPKAMTLGQLAQHVATVLGSVASFVNADKFELPQEFRQETAASAEALIPTLTANVAQAKEIISSWDDATAMATWSLTKGDQVLMAAPRVSIIRSIGLNHWYHHRGQLSVYLRELDVALPSIYGPSADENPFQ